MHELLVVNPNTSPAITRLIARQVEAALPAGTRARTLGVDWGTPSVETRIDAAVASVAVLDVLAQQQGMQGVLVAAFGDPGLLAARELLDVPVVGIGESALLRARELGDFAILTLQPASVPLVAELVRANHCEDRCVAIAALPVAVLDAADPGALRERLAEHAVRLARSWRIQSVVLGGAPLGLHAEHLSGLLGLPCINPVAAGLQRLAALAAQQDLEHRSPSYRGLRRKNFEGPFSFLEHLNQALWR
ncbi:MAG TPA: aspartate/glutamate racemase family protein [Ramlibacter sp.]|nr:aspartate/glutamate racemase family protein [Ramlibacter sp.]